MSTPVLDQRATESYDVTIVRAIDAQQILDQIEHEERPYAAWAKRAARRVGRRSGVSFDEHEEVTLTNIAGPTFAVSRSSKVPPAPEAMASGSVSTGAFSRWAESRAYFATGAVALLILVLTCAALASAAAPAAESRPAPATATAAR